jgi:hypothetical protein
MNNHIQDMPRSIVADSARDAAYDASTALLSAMTNSLRNYP